MKPEIQIQKAHDILTGILLGELPVKLSPKNQRILQSAANALCWVLEHEHNQRFDTLLAELEKTAVKAGFILTKPGDN